MSMVAAEAAAGGAAAGGAEGAAASRGAAAAPEGSTATRTTESPAQTRQRIFGSESHQERGSGPGGTPGRTRKPAGGSGGGRAGGGQSRGGGQRRGGHQNRSLRLPSMSPEFRNYQGIILAEFIAAELLVAATPIAIRKGQPGLSPYVPRDMTKLLAIGVLYFLLELAAVGGRGPGRAGAWFGGLILLVTGMNEAANVAKVLNLFAGTPPTTTSTSTSGTGGIEAGGGPVLPGTTGQSRKVKKS